jgi:hypothetical protein
MTGNSCMGGHLYELPVTGAAVTDVISCEVFSSEQSTIIDKSSMMVNQHLWLIGWALKILIQGEVLAARLIVLTAFAH